MKKCFGGLLLSLLLCLSLLPATALAEGGEGVTTLPYDFSEINYTLTGGTAEAPARFRLSNSGVDYLAQTITVTGYVTLDLYGMSLEPNTGVNVPAITVADGGHLTLTDSTSDTTYWKKNESGEWEKAVSGYTGDTITTTGGWITGGTGQKSGSDDCGGGVYVANGGSLTMTGGNIINNTAGTGDSSGCGGGVYVASGGSFTMSGGTIFGNSASSHGGGVYVDGTGTFTMSGDAKIWYNTSGWDGGGVYVAGDTSSAEEGFVHFTMNGGTICNNTGASKNGTYGNGGGGVGVNGGSFKMTDGTISDNTAMPTDTSSPLGITYGGGVFVREGGSFTMEGGTISGNAANGKKRSGYGGGVAVMDSTFQMSDTAAISGNSATGTNNNGDTGTGFGGGVYVSTTGNDTAEFTMSGGTIGGTNDEDKNTASHGGGVCLENNSTFTMSGSAAIRGNEATGAGDTQGHGGGVMVGINNSDDTTQFTMTGGTISGNTASTSGGGVEVFKGTLTMSGGTIGGTAEADKNTAPRGGGVNLDNDSTFTMEGGSITGNTATFGGGGVYQNGGTFTMKAGAVISGNSATGTENTNGGGGVYVAYGTFNMENGTIGGATGEAANSAKQGGGVYVGSRSSNTNLKGTFNMSGGSITGNTVQNGEGGGVYMRVGSFTMKDSAVISGNSARNYGGGGVYMSGGSFTMTDGSITGNTANTNGGGVYLCAETAAGTFTMEGGEISGNKANNCGGGVCMYGLKYAAQFTMTGGSITGNSANDKSSNTAGGGVRADSANNSTFTVSGHVTIQGNVKDGTLDAGTGKYIGDTTDNVRLKNADDTITVGGALTGGANSIGVSTATTPSESSPVQFAVGTAGDDGYTLTADDKKSFFPDLGSTTCHIILNNDNTLSLKHGPAPHTHSWTYTLSEDKKTITHTCTAEDCPLTDRSDGSVTITAPTVSEGTLTYDGSAKAATVSGSFATGVTAPTNADITYKVKNGSNWNDLPTGTTAPTNAGTYKAGITVGTGESAVTAYVEYTIAKATPTASNLQTLGSTALYYNGDTQGVTYYCKSGIVGMGTITVKYFRNDVEVSPINAGTYTYKVSVAGGDNYTAAADLIIVDNYMISAKSLQDPDIAITLSQITYDGTAKTPTVTVKYGETMLLAKDTDYELSGTTTATNAGNGYTVTITGKGNYKDSVNRTWSINKADLTGVSVTQSAALTYTGSAQTAQVTAAATAKGEQTVTFTYCDTADGTYGAAVPAFTDAGLHTVYYKASASNHNDKTDSFTVTIGEADNAWTTAPAGAQALTYTGSAQNLLSVNGTPTGGTVQYKVNGGDWSTTVPTATDAGTYTVSYKVVGGTNYKDIAANTDPITVTIAKKPIRITGATATDRSYVVDRMSVEISGVTFEGTASNDSVSLTMGSEHDYTVTGTMANANAGNNKDVDVTVTLSNTNYSLAVTMTTTTVNISKVDYPGTTTANGSAKYGNSGEVDLSALIASGGTGAVGTVTDNDHLLNGDPGFNNTGKKLSFTFANTSGNANKTLNILVNVTGCTNYNDYTITVTVKVNAKTAPNVTAPTVIADLTYNGAEQTLVNAGTVSTGCTMEYRLGTDGTWATAVPKAKNAAAYTVYYRVTGNEEYADVAENSVTVTIGSKAVTVRPKAFTITKGTAIPAFELEYTGLVNGDSLTPSTDPTFTCLERDNTTAVSTSTAAGTYTITWTNRDSVSFTDTNYTVTKEEAATLTITDPPYTGGGSSTPAVTVPVSSDAGSVNVRAEVSNGTATVNVSTRQLEQVTAGGSGSVTVDVSGVKNVESVKLPARVVETTAKAEDTGLTVALPDGSVALDGTALGSVSTGKDITVSVKEVPATDLNEKQRETVGDMANIGIVVDVDVFVGGTKQSSFNGGRLTISIPYTPKRGEDTGKLTVWFIRDDGTIENKGGYYDTENGCFVFVTDHLSRYVLVYDNKPVSFADVPADAYYAEAVGWAVSRNITEGIGGDLFGPEVTCTRAQIVTFLYRCAIAQGVDVSVGADTNILSYTDALDVPEYAFEAFQWACGAGILQGADGRLMPKDDCTRAQIVTMLYRYAAVKGMNAVTLQELVSGYDDAAEVPGYALPAFNWALANGIVQGYADKLMPNAPCTRAQIVTMLHRANG